MQFTVGFKHLTRSRHVTVEGSDALVAALKVKAERPDAQIMYVRSKNRRGDIRHPALERAEECHRHGNPCQGSDQTKINSPPT